MTAIDRAFLSLGGIQLSQSQDGVVATAGGGQASAAQISQMYSRVATVATVGDSVLLPPAVGGCMVAVVNNGANAVTVFGKGTDTINNIASISQPAGSVDLYVSPAAGVWYVESGVGFAGSLFTESAQSNITAFAGGGQGSATQITTQTARVTTAATPGDSVKLPVAVPGLELMVINRGANPIQVFGSGTDTVAGQAAATGVSQMQNSLVIYVCAAAGIWETEGLASGFGGPGLATSSAKDAITAFAGGGQASATQLAAMINRITTVVTAADSVKMPVSAAGLVIQVINAAAVNAVNVFPATGEQINALGANAAFSIPAGKSATFLTASAGQWHTVLSA